jgi:hypothetical protein
VPQTLQVVAIEVIEMTIALQPLWILCHERRLYDGA